MPSDPKTLVSDRPEPVRLDRFLTDRFGRLSRAYLQGLIRAGKVRLNGRSARKGDLVSAGDEVRVEAFEWPEDRRIDGNPAISLKIVWQSADVLVADKPAGLPTHPNDFGDRDTFANALVGMFPNILDVGDDPLRPGIVHRLDTDTSGLLLVARNQPTFRALRTLFDERRVRKLYRALVLGDVPEAGEVSLPLAHHPRNPRMMVAVKPGVAFRSREREARTIYEPVERFGNYTRLDVRTLTGRMHQVRVHLSAIGHPLAGDRLYQTPNQRRQDRSGLSRHFLHAAELTLPMPPDGAEMTFQSALPPELEDALAALR